MKKKIVRRVLIVFAAILLLMVGMFVAMGAKMKRQVEAFDKTPVDLSKVQDGTYVGESETTLVKAQVQVQIKNGSIQEVRILKHECGRGTKANVIADDMVAQNTVEVDAISGATMSSEVLKDAVRKALREGL